MTDVKPVVTTAPATGGQSTPQASLNPAEPPKPSDSGKTNDGAVPGSKTDPAALLAALQEVRAELKVAKDNQRAAEDALSRVSTAQPGVQPTVQAPPPQYHQVEQEIQKAWDDGEPQKATNMQIIQALSWYDSMSAKLEMQRDTLRSRYDDFNKYESQAMNYVRGLPINQRALDGVVEMAYLIEKGKSANQIVKTAQEQAVEDVIRRLRAGESIQGISGGSGGNTNPISTPGNAINLSAEQLNLCKVMGIKPEDYIQNMRTQPTGA